MNGQNKPYHLLLTIASFNYANTLHWTWKTCDFHRMNAVSIIKTKPCIKKKENYIIYLLLNIKQCKWTLFKLYFSSSLLVYLSWKSQLAFDYKRTYKVFFWQPQYISRIQWYQLFHDSSLSPLVWFMQLLDLCHSVSFQGRLELSFLLLVLLVECLLI